MGRAVVVTAYTAGPIIDNGDPIHLDGVLGLVHALRHTSEPIDRRTRRAELREQHLPLARIQWGGAWVWLCSAAHGMAPEAPAAVWQTRRRDAEDWARLDRPVNVQAGPDKDVLLRRQARVCAGLRWYAWGSGRQIRKDLELLWGPGDAPSGFLGSARRSGAGQITRWSVEPGDHDPMRCLLVEGMAARHIPAAWVERAAVWTTGAVAPPYWLPDGQQDVPRIGREVRLRPEVVAEVGRCAS